MRLIIKTSVFALLGMLLAAEAIAATPEEIIRPIQDQWAEIKYRMPDGRYRPFQRGWRPLRAECAITRKGSRAAFRGST